MNTETMNHLMSVLTEREAPVINYLLAGLSSEEIELKSRKADLIFSPDLIALYNWKNGTKKNDVPIGQLWMFPLGAFIDINTAIDIYANLVNQDEYWTAGMYPVFGSGVGEYFLIDLNKKSATNNQIFFYCPNETDFEVVISFFDSLQSCIATVTQAYLKKAFFFTVDNEGERLLNCNMIEYRKIAKQLNPNSKYWQLHN